MYYNAHHSRDWALRFCTENEEAPAVFMPLSFREELFPEARRTSLLAYAPTPIRETEEKSGTEITVVGSLCVRTQKDTPT
jgi:hypothetical protein